MTKQTKEITIAPTEQELAELKSMFPVVDGFTRIALPRISFISQDKTEGKGKAMKVVAEAGTFMTEKEGEEVDEDDKKIWEKNEVGTSFDGIIIYQRKQLKMYDANTETFTSSPIYDNDEDVIPLFSNKAEIDRGTPKDLKKKYEFVDDNGKTKSKLEDNRILYILYNDELFQLNLRGSSMYAYMTFSKKYQPNTILTTFDSEAKEKGSIAWNQITYTKARDLSGEEVARVIEVTRDLKYGIDSEKAYYASQTPTPKDNNLENFG
jgi:hypothetical protein